MNKGCWWLIGLIVAIFALVFYRVCADCGLLKAIIGLIEVVAWLVFGAVALLSFAYFMHMCECTEKSENKGFSKKVVVVIELVLLGLITCGVYTFGKWLDGWF